MNQESGIYALCCPDSGDVRYIGQAKSIARRYSQHCRATCNFNGYPKARWVTKLLLNGKQPSLRVIELTNDLDSREVFWIAHYKAVGARLLNVSDGGGSMRHQKESKSSMPWAGKRAPVQSGIAAIASSVRFLIDAGEHDRAERLQARLDEARRISRGMQKAGVREWVLYNLAYLQRFPHMQKEYSPIMDWDKASEIIGC